MSDERMADCGIHPHRDMDSCYTCATCYLPGPDANKVRSERDSAIARAERAEKALERIVASGTDAGAGSIAREALAGRGGHERGGGA